MYNYEKEKPQIFTEKGQSQFLRIRDRALELLKEQGSVTMEAIIKKECGDSWFLLACVDRLVEIGEIREIDKNVNKAAQHRLFIKS